MKLGGSGVEPLARQATLSGCPRPGRPQQENRAALRSAWQAFRLFGAAGLFAVVTAVHAAPPTVELDANDVGRFFTVYDAADRRPTAAQLQAGYLDTGSPALKTFVDRRGLTAAGLAEAVALQPALFENARRCASLVPAVQARLVTAMQRLSELYPPASFPPVTLLIGRGRTGGTTSRAGVLIGLETLCSLPVFEPDLESRLVHLIVHEYAHVQQSGAEQEDDKATVLHASLLEGGAEFVAELVSGSVSYGHLHRWTRGQERSIEQAFLEDKDRTDKSRWLWSGLGSPEAPGDLGYWVGYRIVKAYYGRAADKRQALADIFTLADPEAFLKASGWVPGASLP